ncbi:MAG: nucleoside deaminase, partial [Chloroflexota bacterium]
MSEPDHQRFMRMAIAMAHDSAIVDRTGSPFACVIVRDREVVGAGVNRVPTDNDPTSHAEVVAIRAACRKLGTYVLAGCTLYSTG